MKLKINKTADLAMLITMLDKRDDETGNQLSFTHSTSIAWKVKAAHEMGMKKNDIIKHVINTLDVIHVQPKDGNERKGKFSHSQVSRTIKALNEMLRWYWFPWSKIRRDLNRVCK
jgi:hypothetical protein